jgi:hypothetical protein
MKAQSRRVNFFESEKDMEVLILGELGFSTRFITGTTGLTPCQVGYRLHKGEVRRGDYRNGESAIAQQLYNDVTVRRQLWRHTTKQLKKGGAK